MAKEYQPLVVRTGDGRVVTGILKEETADTLTLQTQNELVVISKADIDESKQSDKSMMPDNQLLPFTSTRSARSSPISAPAGRRRCWPRPTTSATFFNGKDLAGWVGDAKLW